MSTDALQTLGWPLARLGAAIATLARHAGLHPAEADLPELPPALQASAPLDVLDDWLDWAGVRLGLQAEAVDAPVPEVMATLAAAAPAVLCVQLAGQRRLLLLVGLRRRGPGGGAQVWLLAPDGRRHACPLAAVRNALCSALEAPLAPAIDALLDAAQLPAARRPRARAALLAERLAGERVPLGWVLRLPATAPFGRQLAQAGLPRRVAALLAVFAAAYALEIAGWRLIGGATLGGRLDRGWLFAWLLLLFTLVPLQLLGGWLQGGLALEAGRLLKQRLLAGALRLAPDAVRQRGAGQWLGRVMEAQALEGLALGGALAAGISAVELTFAGWVLAQGAGGAWHAALLAGAVGLSLVLAWRYHRRLRHWTLLRLDMTHALLEAMAGHRTRLAQEQAARRDRSDDQALAAHLESARAMDAALVPLAAGLPGGWMLAGLAVLAPALVAGAGPLPLAIAVGGLLFAHRALAGLGGGLAGLARAAIAWQQARELFRAGAVRAEDSPAAPFVDLGGADHAAATPAATRAEEAPTPLIDATGLVFRHRPGGAPVLRGIDLQIRPGERLLLDGPSGGGKSTLAALLTGLRQPESGLLLLQGLDRPTLGEAWHRGATAAPQFHENHVLTGTLAFNLLMGRPWPAQPAALAEAQALCEALGLGELIARMPAGLGQRVGETGWQLSHGERSRLFLARALLQRAPLTVLDESFAALDPATLRRCLDAAMQRSHALMVIAHP